MNSRVMVCLVQLRVATASTQALPQFTTMNRKLIDKKNYLAAARDVPNEKTKNLTIKNLRHLGEETT